MKEIKIWNEETYSVHRLSQFSKDVNSPQIDL